MAIDLPDRDGKVNFLEVLHALAGSAAGTMLPEEEEVYIHERMFARQPSLRNPTKFYAGHYFAALYVQAAVRGFIARYQMRDMMERM